jgi:DNA-binding transcriptional MerR regulator
MDKSPEAFRTISEVAEQLETPAHVLRFWESRFPQIKPVKRAGGRRYYRPADVALLGGIRHLLHDEGMTIRGVQKILREQGVRHVAAMAEGGDALAFDADSDDLGFVEVEDAVIAEGTEAGTAQVFALDLALRPPAAPQAIGAEVVPLRAVPDQNGSPVAPMPESAPTGRTPAPTDPVEEAPEAGHVWVDDEPELALGGLAPLFAVPVPEPEVRFMDQAPAHMAVKLSGFAARLRGLPHKITAENGERLAELHSRLGLLHAQIAEALRLRR